LTLASRFFRSAVRDLHLRGTSCALALVFLLGAPAAHAQPASGAYPNRPVRLVVPNAPGGGSDLVARLVAERLTAPLGRPVVVENRAGASGQLAAEAVARAAPDGHTLLLGTSLTLTTTPALNHNLPYQSPGDFAPIALVAVTSYVLVLHPSVPVRSVADFIKLARTKQGRLNYASPGAGSTAHLATELFSSMTGLKLVHVPYKGSAPGMLSVLQGETDLMFANLLPAIPMVKAGRLRALAISAQSRSPLLPEVPTVNESGLRGFDVEQFYGVVAPAGTPKEIIARLNEHIVQRMQTPEVRARLLADGSEVKTSTPAAFQQLIVSELAKWTKVIRSANIKTEQQ
jgi:tripartite-type tricarboxylate transporter receptor subunit TctC